MDWDGPLLSIEEDGFGPQIIPYQGPTCNYQSDCAQAGSSRSICGLVALSCARLALKLEAEDIEQTAFLHRMVSQTTVNDMMAIVNLNDLKVESHLDIEDLLEIPIFQETFTAETREDIQSLDALNNFFSNWFPDASTKVHAVVFSNDTEVVACLKIPIFGSHIYALFDSHTRPNHRNGPAFTLSSQLDEVAKSINQILLHSSSVSDDNLSQTHKLSARLLELKADAPKRDMHDMLARSAVYLSRRQMGADDAPNTLPFVESDHLSLLRLRAETLRKIRSQELSNSQPIPSSSSPSDHIRGRKSSTGLQHRGEFGWQLSLLLNPDSVSANSGNQEDDRKDAVVSSSLNSSHDVDNKENIPPALGFSRRSEYGWLTSFLQGSVDDTEDQEDVKPPVPSKDDPKTGPFHSQPGEFGWQLALQQRTEMTRGITSGKKSSPLNILKPGGNLPAEESLRDNKDTWEAALLQQLQEEEEIAASLSHHVSGEHAWLVSLQKRLQEEENAKSNGAASSSLSRSDLDWQLAVQLQQEVYRDEGFDTVQEKSPRIVVESEDDDVMVVDKPPSYSQSRDGNYLRVPTWRGSEDTSTFTTLDIPNQSSQQSFECGICGEMHDVQEKLTLSECDHNFCKDCLTTFTKTKIEEGRYPIFCPECLAQRNRTSKSHVAQDIVDKLDITVEELRRLEELQLVGHSITLECPRCKESMNVDREQYGEQSIIVCPLPRCGHKWCKSCLKTVASSEENHRCKNGNIDRLMRRKGWKYCPGCRTPVQKESGCNHMTCGAPGCNVHFCYRCGVLMIDTTNGGDVGTAVTEHYLNCRLFEKRLRCSIQ